METNESTLRIAPDNIQWLDKHEVFVFGSNLLGKHGGGAARTAYEKFGAVMGVGIGAAGKTFAIPTKGVYIETLPLEQVKYYVDYFIKLAPNFPKRHFLVTQVGCGLAGFEVKDIAPLFRDALSVRNIYLPKVFLDYLNSNDDN